MARKVSISKDVILEAALKMLIRDGYSAINIKTLAAEIGCSTQPLVWHFENMEGLRYALAQYARDYANKKNPAATSSKTSADAFEYLGMNYVKMAIKEPNLFKFLYLGESPMGRPFILKDLSDSVGGEKNISGIAHETGMNAEQATRVVQNTIIYSHGIATMLATGVFKATEKQVMAMIKNVSEAFVRNELEGRHE